MRASDWIASGWLIFGLAWILLVLPSCTTPQVVIEYRCPSLANPTPKAVDALVTTGEKDPSTAAWVIDLDRHYQKCDVINKLADSKAKKG